MKIICAKAGLPGNFTNHSGKWTCATQLYMSGVDEQEIMKRTVHRSEKAVRKYKRSSDEISENVSNILIPPTPCSKKIKKEESAESMEYSVEKLPKAAVVASNGTVLRDITEKSVFQNCHIAFNFR